MDLCLKIYGTNFVPRSQLNELQVLEEKRSQLRALLTEGRNWVEDYDERQEELKKIDEEIRVKLLIKETLDANAESLKTSEEMDK